MKNLNPMILNLLSFLLAVSTFSTFIWVIFSYQVFMFKDQPFNWYSMYWFASSFIGYLITYLIINAIENRKGTKYKYRE